MKKPLLSKNNLIIFAILAAIFCFDGFFLKPAVQDHYLSTDLQDFNAGYWRYQLVAAVIFTVAIILLMKVKNLATIVIILLFSGFFTFWGFKTLISNILLYVNSHTEKDTTEQIYQVINHRENKVFWLDAGGKKSIHDHGELSLIDERRKSGNQKSIFTYQNMDTLHIHFKKGILNINYLD